MLQNLELPNPVDANQGSPLGEISYKLRWEPMYLGSWAGGRSAWTRCRTESRGAATLACSAVGNPQIFE